MSYLTLEEMKAYISAQITTAVDDYLLTEALQSAQKEIDGHCGRSFESSTGTRYYRETDIKDYPGIANELLILDDDLQSVSTLTNGDDTTITSTDYWLEPRNKSVYSRIHLKTGKTWIFNTDGEVAVAGTWGFTTAADSFIKEMTREVAAYLYQLRSAPVYDVVTSPAEGVITIPKGMPQHVKYELDRAVDPDRGPYKKFIT